jgi:hypothetical protein
LALIMKVTLARHEDRNLPGLALTCKDFRTISLYFIHPEHQLNLSTLLKQTLFPAQILYACFDLSLACSVWCVCVCVCARAPPKLTPLFSLRASASDLFAYKNKEQFGVYNNNASGFSLYDPSREFTRLGLSADEWRITNSNYDFRFPRFPNQFIVPEKMSDGTATLLSSLPLRLVQRLTSLFAVRRADAINVMWKSPLKWRRWTLALCWRSAKTKACLLRSAKVLVAEEAKGVTADFDADRAPKLNKDARKHRSMLQQLLLLHEDSRAVHVFITSAGAKKKSRSDAVSLIRGATSTDPYPLERFPHSAIANDCFHWRWARWQASQSGLIQTKAKSSNTKRASCSPQRWSRA